MAETVLVTGGCGFIGRHVARELLSRGYRVRALDALVEQVHGPAGRVAATHDSEVDVIVADVRDQDAVRRALEGVDSVIHLAAEVGVGQSMYEIARYTGANELGTAVLLEELIEHPVRRIVTASSMSIYGEGLYRAADGSVIEDAVRRPPRDGQREWNPLDREGNPLSPLPTPEWKRPVLSSIYALNKYAQEQATHIVAAPFGMESVCLRLFNVYGPGQALSNPYTGVLAIFSSRLASGERPMIFEDGLQRRDFVHVRDVARAFADALETPEAAGGTFNIGSGVDRSVRDIALALAEAMGRAQIEPEILGRARAGDIRHCFADAGRARDVLGFEPREDFAAGLAELAQWVEGQEIEDKAAQARLELERRGLVA